MEKKIKKGIVNGLTLSRILGTILMPFMVNTLSAPIFLVVIGLILFTDCLDGVLARRWDVSTIFGSLADMTADKLFGFAILIVLSTMFPVMAVPLALEILISGININGAYNGSISKSSQLGRIKTWIMGLSIFSLLIVGLSPQLMGSLNSVKMIDIENSFIIFKDELLNKVIANKDIIENIVVPTTIVSESLVAADYFIKSIKKVDKNSTKFKISELIKNREFIKQILFDEKYYKATKDMSLKDKLLPTEEQKDSIKKLMLELEK